MVGPVAAARAVWMETNGMQAGPDSLTPARRDALLQGAGSLRTCGGVVAGAGRSKGLLRRMNL